MKNEKTMGTETVETETKKLTLLVIFMSVFVSILFGFAPYI